MASRLLHRLAALAGLLLLPLLTPTAAHADGGLGLRVDGDPGSQLDQGFIHLVVNAGGVAGGHFYVSNTSPSGANLAVYPADGLTGTTTGVVYADSDDPVTEAGAWVTPGVRSVAVPAREERRIDFTVSVPSGAGAGDHVAAVVMQQSRPGSTQTGQISQVVRNVMPIMIEVPGPAGPQIDIKSAAITALPGTTMPAVTVTMRNVGAKLCKPILSVGLASTDGTKSVSRQLDTILPGDRAPYALPWPTTIEPGSHVVSVNVSNCGSTDTATVKAKTPDVLIPGGTENELTTKPRPGGGATDVQPGTTTFIPPKSHGAKSGDKRKRKNDSQTDGTTAAGGAGSGTPRGPAAPSPGQGTASGAIAKHGAGGGVGHWLKGAAKTVIANAPAVATRASVPLSLLALIGLLFFVQEAFDRKDPKLALASVHREQDLEFDPDPLGSGRVIPLPTALGT